MTPYASDIRRAAQTALPWHTLEGKSVLVTGATGLIGGAVVDLLMACGARCTVYAAGRDTQRAERRFAAYATDSRLRLVKMDVTQPIEGDATFDYIIDAAGGAAPRLYKEDPVGVMMSNLAGVDNLLSYGVRHGLRRFVYVSSGEVYGEGDGRAFTEDYSGYVDPMQVRSCYPSAKRAAETLAVCHGAQHGVEVVVARPSHVYGPGFTPTDNRVYAQFIRNVLQGDDIVLKSKGEAYRSWTYVADCATALLSILMKGENGKAYNIADEDSNITIRELADLTASIAGRKVVMQIPDDAQQGVTTPITKAVFSTARLQSLDWQAQWHIAEGLRHTIDTLRVTDSSYHCSLLAAEQ